MPAVTEEPTPARADADLMAPVSNYELAVRAENERVEALLLSVNQQAKYEMVHWHTPGIYGRQITMFAGTELIGAEHLGKHLNLVMKGRALVKMQGRTEEIVAPCVFISNENVRKTLLILEDMVWITIHPNPNNLTSPKDLFDMIARKSAVHQKFDQLVKEPRFVEHGKQFGPTKEEIIQ